MLGGRVLASKSNAPTNRFFATVAALSAFAASYRSVSDIIARARVGTTGYAYAVDGRGVLATQVAPAGSQFRIEDDPPLCAC
jgi:hypothetical protein